MNRKTFIVLHEATLGAMIIAALMDLMWLFWLAMGVGVIVDLIRRKTLGKSLFGWNESASDSYFDRFLKK